MTIKWMNPPKREHKAFKYQPIIDALMDRPNVWGLVAEDQPNRNISDSLRQKPGIECTTRMNANRRIDVYARYVEPSRLGECTRCGKRGKVNENGLCRIHAPLGKAAA